MPFQCVGTDSDLGTHLSLVKRNTAKGGEEPALILTRLVCLQLNGITDLQKTVKPGDTLWREIVN